MAPDGVPGEGHWSPIRPVVVIGERSV